ncbi:MAG: hypothetical protein LBQ32_00225 [Burkholderiaceae bacterium]|jgi:hypothetical protein|nr:hypothetical protein [Burkholderiaceae bacterium]
MNIDILSFDEVHLLGDHATRSPAPRSPRHAELLSLAGISPLRPRALPAHPMTACSGASNCGFQVETEAIADMGCALCQAGSMRLT